MANIIEYIIKGVDDTRAANASARAEMEKTKTTASTTSESASKSVRSFGEGFRTLTKVISYGTAVLGAFMGGWKAGTWIYNWIQGVTSGMTKFRDAIAAASDAKKKLMAKTGAENERTQARIEGGISKDTAGVKSADELAAAKADARNAAAEVAKAEIDAQTEERIKANPAAIETLRRLADERKTAIDKSTEVGNAQDALDAAAAEEALVKRSTEVKQKEYAKQKKIQEDAAKEYAEIIKNNPMINTAQSGNNDPERQAEIKRLLKKTAKLAGTGLEAAAAMKANETDPNAVETATQKRIAAEKKVAAAKLAEQNHYATVTNDQQKRIEDDRKKAAEEAKKAADELAKKAEEAAKAKQRFTLEDKMESARAAVTPAAEQLAKAKENSALAMRAYRDPEFRRGQKDAAREQAQVEKSLQRDLARVDEKTMRASKWNSSPYLTDREKTALAVREAKKEEDRAKKAQEKALKDVESIAKDMKDFLRKNTLGGNT